MRLTAMSKVSDDRSDDVPSARRTTLFVAFIACLVLSGCGTASSASGCAQYRFDSERWKPASSWAERPSVRQGMVGELLECGTLVGKTERQVIVLLGEPELPVAPNQPGSRPCYELGPQPGLSSLDNEGLCLTYSQSGRLVEAEVVNF